MTTEPWKIINPQEYLRGWHEKIGVMVYQRPYQVIRKLDDGNYLVKNPELTVLESEASR